MFCDAGQAARLARGRRQMNLAAGRVRVARAAEREGESSVLDARAPRADEEDALARRRPASLPACLTLARSLALSRVLIRETIATLSLMRSLDLLLSDSSSNNNNKLACRADERKDEEEEDLRQLLASRARLSGLSSAGRSCD